MPEMLLKMEGITKQFPGVLALDHCNLKVNRGEVLGLIGENGAGKSTLMKILCGIYVRDEGKIEFEGKDVNFLNTRQAMDEGICIIHQELNLMPHLSIFENIFIGRETDKKHGFICKDKDRINKTEELFRELKLSLNPLDKVDKLTIAQQQMVEIAKALSFNSKLLVMDEPTSPLTNDEIDVLFEIIEDLKKKGIGIIYISHRMNELKRICDRVTIMRDGCVVKNSNINDISIDEIVSTMVGRKIDTNLQKNSAPPNTEIVLKVENLCGLAFKNISFELHKGEILGFAGLVGAGRTEVARAIFGADPIHSGKIFIHGTEKKIYSTVDAVKQGIGYLSEDRKKLGLITAMDIIDNTALPNYDKLSNSFGVVNKGKAYKVTADYISLLKTKTPTAKQKVKNLSGGNQQKVVIAKWLLKDCDILIFDEPTRGIDVGAKAEIYKLIESLAEKDKSIIVISSELEEVLRLSDRVVIMSEGKITGVLNTYETNQEEIMSYATAEN